METKKQKIISVIKFKSFWEMLFLGFSGGLPIVLFFGTLGIWLQEAGTSKSVITFFSWAGLGYSFKFLWAPLVDQFPIPFLTKKLGQRRSWLLTTQILIILFIVLMGATNPLNPLNPMASAGKFGLLQMAIFAVLLGFVSATQDIAIDAYRIECAPAKMQGLLSSSYVAGYRIAMIVSGAGVISLAQLFGSVKNHYSYSAWANSYYIVALFALIGVITTIFLKEPINKFKKTDNKANIQTIYLFIILIASFIGLLYFTSYLSSLVLDQKSLHKSIKLIINTIRYLGSGALSLWVIYILSKLNLVSFDRAKKLYLEPIKDFFSRFDRKTLIIIILIIAFYKISDYVLGIIANLFYKDIGFTKIDIAQASKTFGLLMSITGSFLGGFYILRTNTLVVLLAGAILAPITNLLFLFLSNNHNITTLYLVIGADNLVAGIAATAFVAFLSRLTKKGFSATQYALFTSIMLLMPKLIGGYSGTMVESYGYNNFFIFTTIIGLPIIALVYILSKKLPNF